MGNSGPAAECRQEGAAPPTSGRDPGPAEAPASAAGLSGGRAAGDCPALLLTQRRVQLVLVAGPTTATAGWPGVGGRGSGRGRDPRSLQADPFPAAPVTQTLPALLS